MPFTVSHIAAVLPLRKRLGIVWSACAFGSMAPDMEYFVRFAPHTAYGHHYPGVFTFSLPIALLMFWLYEQCLRTPMLELMAAGVEARVELRRPPFPWTSVRAIASALTWILIGIATHLAWDSFTHYNGVAVMQWRWLRMPHDVPLAGRVPTFDILQMGCSILGLVLIAIPLWRWYGRTAPRVNFRPAHSNRYKAVAWSIMVGISAGGGLLGAYFRTSTAYSHPLLHNPGWFAAVVIEVGLGLLMWSVIAYSVIRNMQR